VTRSAIVIGGGIGGLASAIALRRIGWSATVLERDEVVREVGAGLSLAPNAMRALDALGVGPQAREVGMPTWSTNNLRAPSGRYLLHALPGGDPALRAFRRAGLHRLLRDAVPPAWLRTGVEVTGIHQSNGKVTVAIGSEELTAELVVGADGIHSTTRRLLWPDALPPRFLHYRIWVGLAETGQPVGPDGAAGLDGSVTIGRGQYFLIHPVGPRQAYWALGTAAESAGDRSADTLGEVRGRIGSWHDPIPSLLAATPPETVRRLDIHDLPPLPGYVSGNLALLGDAAHAMSPDQGQGASQTLEDAVVLAAALAAEPDVPAALARYDQERRPRTQSIQRAAHRDGQRMVGGGAAASWTRTLALRLTPSKLWQRVTGPDSNRVWRWTPPALG
jgi:2-polyprenyl-6-methoxyphenol hydroxylase-like FAD-dependent oxidoreductase